MTGGKLLVCLAGSLLAALPACNDGDHADGDTDADADGDTPMCFDYSETHSTADVFDRQDFFPGTCGVTGTPDVAFTFRAERAGLWEFSTQDPLVDTWIAAIALLDGECGGQTIGCGRTMCGNGVYHHYLLAELGAGETVTVVVELSALDGVGVSVRELDCPSDLDLTLDTGRSAPMYEEPVIRNSSCGSAYGYQRTFGFTAEGDGVYRFRAAAEFTPPALTLWDTSCDGTELACVTAVEDPELEEFVATHEQPLTSGQRVVVGVTLPDDCDGGELSELVVTRVE